MVVGSSTFEGYVKARREASGEVRKAMSELKGRPGVEGALGARAAGDGTCGGQSVRHAEAVAARQQVGAGQAVGARGRRLRTQPA
ncbi:hypothetical protein B1218_35155 [Pseudomonas ogarae]|nr:hypothetical protein B1218_35155 [Pseudomonas ogarae]